MLRPQNRGVGRTAILQEESIDMFRNRFTPLVMLALAALIATLYAEAYIKHTLFSPSIIIHKKYCRLYLHLQILQVIAFTRRTFIKFIQIIYENGYIARAASGWRP